MTYNNNNNNNNVSLRFRIDNCSIKADDGFRLSGKPFLILQGITFEEFRSFFQFLNNLEDFTIAMQMYNFANRSIGQGKRSVLNSIIQYSFI